ncbi:golgin subfamily A member 6-like protein 7 isoform X1 [Brienomyrus brachyistius]|uniref:golgin subfamily A member 6-like protein 7 isoform X1 n=1 Tax=Brienomyrus brachyistius TaxID=42636 RepID=UPI0020B3E6E6|nr:golgin subfamily A member 6-like protein 7 isoform X1 [Brienomyrus brachyistius]XP_048839866.1 golgin subfamily A member 6-like protein 7 isoform X1 [Brienomyrus brachyistius]XP_048839867.1 golgin subfamily A member 6-like protein 7 isoform X1 [Brienomyrus brachyistius]XP_048839868.1 golgin subfamily A member 6-like protein 7 isoform X1 [Brienomyrus brachyistius]XP_048839869.1 golgin subfamily A member 6-like protein 7 isoform X1 [Brienomyrus brachyistius]XP_048839870.1 golgin subfamily A m
MTLCQHASRAPILLLLLYGVAQRLSIAVPVVGDRDSDATAASEQTMQTEAREQWEKEVSLIQKMPEEELLKDMDPRTLAVALLDTISQPVEKVGDEKLEAVGGMQRVLRGLGEYIMPSPPTIAENVYKEPEGGEEDEKNRPGVGQQGLERLTKEEANDNEAETSKTELAGEERLGKEEEEDDGQQDEAIRNLQRLLGQLQRHDLGTKDLEKPVLYREVRGYFPNIDLGLQNNDILPPLKGYKLYNQQLARAGKKLKWQEEKSRKTQPKFSQMNFMRDFEEENEGDGEEEFLTREEEEAQARAEQEEVRRQEAEAQRARAEEERLADIASDRVLQYMVKKQAASYANQRRKAALATNAVEDKRSEEEDDDEDDIDPQTIDKLIEISSKLHLPADDVVDIISDVEEKKKKRKDMPQNLPRYRPLVPPPIPASRYSSTVKSPPFSPYGKWFKGKAKPWKQDFWSKPQKQFLAYPSYPFYQKPYRAYYPVYFPLPNPKSRYFSKPALSFDELLGNSMDREFDVPKHRYRPWGQSRPRKRPARLPGPYIPNYILPHPRTYMVPKPRQTPRLRPSLYYPPPAPVASQDDSYYNLRGQQQDSDEELENFIEKVYLKRRLFQ